MIHVAIVFHSGYGHTAALAEAFARGAQSVAETEVRLIPVAEAEANWDYLDAADAIVFGSPTYMGSISGPFAAFKDATAKAWRALTWKNKISAGFTNSGSQHGDKLNTLQQLALLAMQHGMIWVGLDLFPGHNHSGGSPDDLNRIGSWLGAMSQSNVDQGVEGMRDSDLKTAEHLGQRVANATHRWQRGGESAA